MKKLLYLGLTVIIILAAAYYFWTEIYVFTPHEAMARSNIGCAEILHGAEVEDGVLIFYRDPNESRNICVNYEKRGLTGWKHIRGGGAAVKEDTQDLSWCWFVLESENRKGNTDLTLAVLFGEIDNPDIATIKVKANIDTKNIKIQKPLIEKTAQIIDCEKTRLWYVITDKDMSTAMKVYAYSASGQLLFTGNDW